MKENLLIGFIGQGYIGKNYADDFEERGYKIIRYDIEKYKSNKDQIKNCDIVFIAVPTPTTPKGFKYDIVKDVLKLVKKGKIAVIKSTLLPGTTDILQKKFKNIFIIHSPEFLREVSAAYDARNPERNIIGYTDKSKGQAQMILDILPKAPYNVCIPAKEAELIKYGGNCFLYFKVIFMNLLYDLCQADNIDFEKVKEAMENDSRIGGSHLDVLHKGGRGAGGNCFIKDFAAFKKHFRKKVKDRMGNNILKTIENKNINILINSQKDLNLLEGVYGKKINK